MTLKTCFSIYLRETICQSQLFWPLGDQKKSVKLRSAMFRLKFFRRLGCHPCSKAWGWRRVAHLVGKGGVSLVTPPPCSRVLDWWPLDIYGAPRQKKKDSPGRMEMRMEMGGVQCLPPLAHKKLSRYYIPMPLSAFVQVMVLIRYACPPQWTCGNLKSNTASDAINPKGGLWHYNQF